MSRAPVLALLCLSLACDPTKATDDAVAKAAKTVEKVEEAKAKSAAEAEAKEAQKEETFRTCMAACAADPATEPTDRATCRLQCDQLAGEALPDTPSSNADAVLRTFDTCEAECEGEKNARDTATCRFNCTQTAAAKVEPAGATPDSTHRGCASACLESLVSCTGRCPPGGDDASTCSLHCESDVKRCLGHCEGS
jgi:hypothetical protein